MSAGTVKYKLTRATAGVLAKVIAEDVLLTEAEATTLGEIEVNLWEARDRVRAIERGREEFIRKVLARVRGG